MRNYLLLLALPLLILLPGCSDKEPSEPDPIAPVPTVTDQPIKPKPKPKPGPTPSTPDKENQNAGQAAPTTSTTTTTTPVQPEPPFDPGPGCKTGTPSISTTGSYAGEAISFRNDGSVCGTEEFSWDFGDGTKRSAQAAPTHTYAKPGKYTVKLTVGGESAENQVEVQLNKAKLTAALNAYLGKACQDNVASKECLGLSKAIEALIDVSTQVSVNGQKSALRVWLATTRASRVEVKSFANGVLTLSGN
jgi:hypothetical protein